MLPQMTSQTVLEVAYSRVILDTMIPIIANIITKYLHVRVVQLHVPGRLPLCIDLVRVKNAGTDTLYRAF